MNELIYGLETKEKLMDLYLSNMKKAYECIDKIIPIVWKFDGKVFNKKFENTLKEALELEDITPCVRLDYWSMKIEISFYRNRSISGEHCNYYLPDGLEDFYLCNDYSDFNRYDSTDEKNKKYYDSAFNDKIYFYIDSNYNTRIKSARIVNLLLERQKELKDRYSKLSEDRKNVLDYATKLKGLQDSISALHDSMDYSIRCIYEIKSYGTYCC